jgi:tellurite resistance protein
MFIRREAESEIRPDQVKAMAHGLYYLAEIDGVTPAEQTMLEELLNEGNTGVDVAGLAEIPFSIEGLVHSLDTAFLRKSFIRIAILLARADGKISDEEMAVLRRLAQALGITESLESLAADLEGQRL